MSICIESLNGAAQEIVAATLCGRSWKAALNMFVEAEGAQAAAVSRSTPSLLTGVGTDIIESAGHDVIAGRTPKYSSEFIAYPSRCTGFYSDQDEAFRARMIAIPFYREYVCGVLGIPWRASALIAGPNDIGGARISLWRTPTQGPFQPDELVLLETVLPTVRIAAAIAERFSSQRSELEAQSHRQRGKHVVVVGFGGLVNEESCASTLPVDGPLRVVRGRLKCLRSEEQRELDDAILIASSWRARLGVVRLSRPSDGREYLLTVAPAKGELRDLFGNCAAVCVLLDRRREEDAPDAVAVEIARKAFGLAAREAEIASLVAAGWSLKRIAEKLAISYGTVRNHLKSVMQKMDVHSQAEMTSLFLRLT